MHISNAKTSLIPDAKEKPKKNTNLQKITFMKPINKRPVSAGVIRTTGTVIDLIRKLHSKNDKSKFAEYVEIHTQKIVKETEELKEKINKRQTSLPRTTIAPYPMKKSEEEKGIKHSATLPLGKPPTGRKPTAHESREDHKTDTNRNPLLRPPLIQRSSSPQPKQENPLPDPKFRSCLEDYTIGTQVGQGAYASVKVVVHNPSKQKCAFKTYEKTKLLDPHRKKNVMREIDIMRMLDHPYIVKLYEVLDTPRQLHLVMEYVQGCSLHGYLKRKPNRRLDESEAKKLIKQVLVALDYCHKKNIAHRDIKLENLLLDEHSNVKLIDFGFSTCMPNTQKAKIFCGTPSYMAPEIVSRKEYAGPPVDIWAVGVLMYVFLCGTYPFRGSNDTELYRKIQQGYFTVPQHVSTGAKSLILKILKLDPSRRPTVSEVLKDPWLNTSGLFAMSSDEEMTHTFEYASSINGDALDLDIVCSMKKLGYNESQLLQELQNENSQISKLYKKIKLSRGQSTEWDKRKFMSAGIS